MSRPEDNYDVFLSYPLVEKATAERVTSALEQAGLCVFDPASLETDKRIGEQIRRALAVCDALVVVLPQEGAPSANTGVEVGAAQAWAKPVYVLRPEDARSRVPPYLSEFAIYPLSRVDDVARAVKRGGEPLGDEGVEVLKAVYVEMDTPTYMFARDPALVDELAQAFAARSGTQVPGERLMNEMVRLRKRGQWPVLRKSRSQ